MGRRPVWKAERQNGAAAGKTVCKCGGPKKYKFYRRGPRGPERTRWLCRSLMLCCSIWTAPLSIPRQGSWRLFKRRSRRLALPWANSACARFWARRCAAAWPSFCRRHRWSRRWKHTGSCIKHMVWMAVPPMPVCRRCCRPCGKRGLWCVWPHRNPTRWHCACCAILGWNRHLITLAAPAWTPAWTPRRP